MSSDDEIINLMVRWEDACAAGQAPTIEALCPDDTELQGVLRQRIERRARLLAALDGPDAVVGDAPAPERKSFIEGFDLLEVLGQGGMGVVYKAHQHDLKRIVAVKTLLTGATGPAETARIQREAEAVARLRHPNIIQIHEVGMHEGAAYLVLEYAAGGSLADLLNGAPLTPERAAQIALALARAVQHAHDAGIIHRDLKPANVLIDADGTPKVADFGLAKRLDLDLNLTQTGMVLGSPNYMAPEQAEGRTADVGPTTDVYALGSILYEMLTGRPPFRGATMLETLEQVRSHECVPPRALRPNVPRDLEMICLQCLRKLPSDRYASAAALAEDLRRFLAGETVTARSLTMAEVVGRLLGVNSVDRKLGRTWGTVMVVLAPLACLCHLAVFFFGRSSAAYPFFALSATGATFVVVSASFWTILWPRTRGVFDRSQRRLIGNLMTGYTCALVLFPLVILRGLPMHHPEEALVIYPVWLVFAGSIFLLLGSQVGAFYLTAVVAYSMVALTSLFPIYSPLFVGVALGIDLAAQGINLRRSGRPPT